MLARTISEEPDRCVLWRACSGCVGEPCLGSGCARLVYGQRWQYRCNASSELETFPGRAYIPGIEQGVERPALELLRGLPREVQFCPWETWFTGVETVTGFKQCLVKHVLLRMLISVSDVSDVSVCDVDDLFHRVPCWRVEMTFFL